MASPPQTADSSEFALRLSLAEPEDRVKVYSRATTAQLADTRTYAGNTSSVSQLLPRTGGAKRAATAKAEAARSAEWLSYKREILYQKHAVQLEKTLAQHRRGREKEKDKEHVKFEELYGSLVAEEAGFINDVQAFLHTQARQEVRKREALHKQWDEAIYQKVYHSMVQVLTPPWQCPSSAPAAPQGAAFGSGWARHSQGYRPGHRAPSLCLSCLS